MEVPKTCKKCMVYDLCVEIAAVSIKDVYKSFYKHGHPTANKICFVSFHIQFYFKG